MCYSRVAELLDRLDAKNIGPTCVDFICFTRLNKKKDREEDEEENATGDEKDFDHDAMASIIPVEDGDRYTRTLPFVYRSRM